MVLYQPRTTTPVQHAGPRHPCCRAAWQRQWSRFRRWGPAPRSFIRTWRKCWYLGFELQKMGYYIMGENPRIKVAIDVSFASNAISFWFLLLALSASVLLLKKSLSQTKAHWASMKTSRLVSSRSLGCVVFTWRHALPSRRPCSQTKLLILFFFGYVLGNEESIFLMCGLLRNDRSDSQKGRSCATFRAN